MTALHTSLLEPVLTKDRKDLCRNVLQVCLPLLPEAPENGWLNWIYDYLTLGLYPDSSIPVDQTLAAAAEEIYLPAHQDEVVKFDPLDKSQVNLDDLTGG